MKNHHLLMFLLIFTSCVSSKKHNRLFLSMETLQKEFQKTEDDLVECNEDKAELKNKVEKLENEKDHLKDQIKNFEDIYGFAKKNNEMLSDRISDLSGSSKVNADIMKKTLEELDAQNQKVLHLSLALERTDSLNVQLVKKTKKKMSDRKLKKSLEKLGFVFY